MIDMKPDGSVNPKSDYVLGVDLARYGEDESVFIVLEKPWATKKVYVILIESTKYKALTDAIGRVRILEDKFNFKKIYIDETGLGAGPVDLLKEAVGWKVEGITFSTQSKMDIYSNLRGLMEKGDLKFPNHKKLVFQLYDLRRQTKSDKKVKIYHSDKGHDDFPDALALACYYFKPGQSYVPMIA